MLPPFEFIPWVLGQCANMKEVRALLAKINITGTPFAENMPAASLHWIIADADEADHSGIHEGWAENLRQSGGRYDK